MKVNEWAGVGNHNTALFWEYDTRTGRRMNKDDWNGNPSVSTYSVFDNSPIWKNDIKGDDPNEYDKDGKQISNLGGDKIDFNHQANGDTKITERATGATNMIKGGEKLISGYTLRDKKTSWGQITNEFLMQQGATNSLLADFDNSDDGAFGSLHSPMSSYASLAREASLSSPDSKGVIKMDYSHANPIAARDMWEQMWGRSNVSWYKLGDKTMFMMSDSKSGESLFYRATGNWERTPATMMGNTRQTYIWVESNKSIQLRVNECTRQFQQILQESKRPGKL